MRRAVLFRDRERSTPAPRAAPVQYFAARGRIEPDFSFERFFQGLVFLFPVAVAGKPGAELLLDMFVGMLFVEVQVDDLLDRFLRVGVHKYSRSDMLEYLFELFFEIVLRNGYAGRSVRPL